MASCATSARDWPRVAVACGDVRNFVSHDAGEFGFFRSAKNEPAIDVEKASGRANGVHFIGVDDLNGEGDAGVGIADKILTDAIDLLDHDWIIVNQFGGALDFLGIVLADGDVRSSE